MKFIEKNRKSRNGFFEGLPSGVKDIIDNSKEDYIVNNLSEGLSNRILFEKFVKFRWPLWLENTTNFSSDNYRSYPNPLLLNTTFREWQVFTNYLSGSEITIDRAGMISGPSGAKWSLEFWICNKGKMYRPQNDLSRVKISRNTKTGEIISVWNLDGFTVTEKIAGLRSSIDEALVSVELNLKKGTADCFLIAAVRPYNNTSLGGVASISIDRGNGIISVNGNGLIGFDTCPDEVLTGSGLLGDIDNPSQGDQDSVQCGFGMASAGLKYGVESGKRTFNFRVALDGESVLPAGKINYNNLFREFALFSEMRLSEGIKADLTDSDFSSSFLQSRLSILNINNDDIAGDSVENFRKLYFFVYALCRTGALDAAEAFLKQKLDSFICNKKNPEFEDVIRGCFLIKSCYEIFIHKRETGFLQTYYPLIRGVSDYVYRFSVDMHTTAGNRSSMNLHSFAVKDRITETIYIFSAISNLSYLARCMGIFGDESKFKNESLRLQSLITSSLNTGAMPGFNDMTYSLISLPEKILPAIKSDEYGEMINSLLSLSGFPIVNPLYGIDMFSSAVILNQLLAAGVNDSNRYYDRLMNFVDGFYITPEYIDPAVKRGSWGDGNSKVVNAVIFSVMRSRLFIDGQERLEIFPVPDSSWFKAGSRVRVENATSRYGIISFAMDILDNEVRLSFSGSPKYLPPDILINIPFNTSIIPGDDFIVKKKIGYNYIINGWPASVRFTAASISA